MLASSYLTRDGRNACPTFSLGALFLGLLVAVWSHSLQAEDYLGEIIITGRQPVISSISIAFENDKAK